MKRIDVTKLAPITRDILRSWTAPSWRADAFDPAYDYYEPDVAPRKQVHRPNLVIHAEASDLTYDHLYVDLDNWA